MADRIGDFRDEDSEPEPLGAEDDGLFRRRAQRKAPPTGRSRRKANSCACSV